MAEDKQEFTTIDQQIELLKRRKLIINDENEAKELLQLYGYYNIINGYKEPYIIKSDNGNEEYKKGTSFHQIYSLFILDHTIRNMVMLSMIDIEERLRSITSYVVAEAFTSNHKEYLKPFHYRDTNNPDAKFSRKNILANMSNALNSGKDPIKYSMDTYNNVPPWILFRGIYMSTLFNFIKLQKPKQKEKIIEYAYNIPSELAQIENIKKYFTESLFLFLDYRNLAAHAGRIYNYDSKNNIKISSEMASDISMFSTVGTSIQSSNRLLRLINSLALFSNKDPVNNLCQTINKAFTFHISQYPMDLEYIINSTGISSDSLQIKMPNSHNYVPLNNYLKTDTVQQEVAATKEQ